MAFKVRKIQFRRWPVTLIGHECGDDGTVAEVNARFVGHFRPIDEAGVLALRAEVFGAGDDEDLAAAARARTVAAQAALEGEFYGRLMCGWEGVTGDDDQPLPWSEQAVQALCTGPDGPAARRALAAAVLEIRFGLAPAKNAVTSPAPGPTPGAGEVATN